MHSIRLAKSKGFSIAFAECTGRASTQILCKHAGAAVVKKIDYATWDGCATAHILRPLPSAGHEGMSLAVIDLS